MRDFDTRGRSNTAYTRQSRPDAGLGLQANVLTTFFTLFRLRGDKIHLNQFGPLLVHSNWTTAD